MSGYTPYSHCESVSPWHCVFDWGTGEDIRQLTEAESDSGSRTQDTEAQPEHVAEATHSVEGEQQVSVPPVDLEKAKLESEEVVLQTPQTKCPEGHDLTPFESETDNFVCSVCECEFPMGTVLYGCRNCDYDLCRECLAHTVFHAGGKDFSVALPEMPATFEAVDNNTNVGPGRDLNSDCQWSIDNPRYKIKINTGGRTW